jgi:hypothetical protein
MGGSLLRPGVLRPLALLLMTSLAACSTQRGTGPAPASAPTQAPALNDVGDLGPQAYASLNHDLSRVLEPVRFDCPKVARSLRKWTKANAQRLRAAIDEVDRWERGASRLEIAAYYRRVFPDISLRVEIGTYCDTHGSVRTSFDDFFVAVGLDGT